MYKLCKTERTAARQRELEQALLHMLEIQRFEEISVSDLCAWMDVPRKAFYRYFSDKFGALAALLDHTWMECELNAIRHAVQDGYGAESLERFFQFWKQRGTLLRALERDGMTNLLVERALVLSRTEPTMFAEFAHAQGEGLREQAVLFIAGGMVMLLVDWMKRDFAQPCEEMARAAMLLLTTPLIQRRSIFRQG